MDTCGSSLWLTAECYIDYWGESLRRFHAGEVVVPFQTRLILRMKSRIC